METERHPQLGDSFQELQSSSQTPVHSPLLAEELLTTTTGLACGGRVAAEIGLAAAEAQQMSRGYTSLNIAQE